MKKISNHDQLLAEKARIRKQQDDLENKILHSWTELKESVFPFNGKHDQSSKEHKKRGDSAANRFNFGGDIKDDLIKSIVVFGVGLLAKKLIEIAEKKINEYFDEKEG